MCVVHSVIDVEVELTVLSPPPPSSRLRVLIPLKSHILSARTPNSTLPTQLANQDPTTLSPKAPTASSRSPSAACKSASLNTFSFRKPKPVLFRSVPSQLSTAPLPLQYQFPTPLRDFPCSSNNAPWSLTLRPYVSSAFSKLISGHYVFSCRLLNLLASEAFPPR